MEHVAAGFSNKEVGAQLGMAEKTVKNHLNSVFAKLDASDRTQAVVIAIDRGIIALITPPAGK
jgi:DNA-binding NarL/FixJ family response regulator